MPQFWLRLIRNINNKQITITGKPFYYFSKIGLCGNLKEEMQFRIFKKENIIQGISDISFGSMRGRKRDKRAIKFLKSLGYKADIKNLIWAEQVFGSKVHICKIEDSGKTIKGADGLISNNRNQVLAIVSADCLPILFYDPKREVIAALHGSRKSLIKGIVKNAIFKLISKFNSKPRDILVGIGPHIRKCHYFMNLTRATLDNLLQSGIKRKNIEDYGICTYCQSKRYFSARKKEDYPIIYNEKTPRFASFIGLTGSKILEISSKNFEQVVNEAVKSIKKGEVLVCPTDTVYGLISDATNKRAVERLFKIKKRKLTKPIPIFVRDIKMAKKLAQIDKNQKKFLKEAWPGKITVVLKRKAKSEKRKIYGVDKKTVGLRIPKYKLITELLKNTNKPLTGTSANISGKPASTKIKEIIKQFKKQKEQPDLIISAGNLTKNKPSKVVDLTILPPKILRK